MSLIFQKRKYYFGFQILYYFKNKITLKTVAEKQKTI